jgi:hypothetical protein
LVFSMPPRFRAVSGRRFQYAYHTMVFHLT